jgi:hypothetical protein
MQTRFAHVRMPADLWFLMRPNFPERRFGASAPWHLDVCDKTFSGSHS